MPQHTKLFVDFPITLESTTSYTISATSKTWLSVQIMWKLDLTNSLFAHAKLMRLQQSEKKSCQVHVKIVQLNHHDKEADHQIEFGEYGFIIFSQNDNLISTKKRITVTGKAFE